VRCTSKLSIITNFYKYYATLSLMHLKRFQHLKELESLILNPLMQTDREIFTFLARESASPEIRSQILAI
jgi:hypothetical protein